MPSGKRPGRTWHMVRTIEEEELRRWLALASLEYKNKLSPRNSTTLRVYCCVVSSCKNSTPRSTVDLTTFQALMTRAKTGRCGNWLFKTSESFAGVSGTLSTGNSLGAATGAVLADVSGLTGREEVEEGRETTGEGVEACNPFPALDCRVSVTPSIAAFVARLNKSIHAN